MGFIILLLKGDSDAIRYGLFFMAGREFLLNYIVEILLLLGDGYFAWVSVMIEIFLEGSYWRNPPSIYSHGPNDRFESFIIRV